MEHNINYISDTVRDNNIDSICDFLSTNPSEINLYEIVSWAITYNRIEIIKIVLLYGIDPNFFPKHRHSLLNIATYTKNHVIMNLLIYYGADVNVSIPLLDAVANQDLEAMRILLDNGADPDKGQPLLLKSGFPLIEIIHLLLEKGANPNIQDYEGRTLLHEAVRYNDKRLIKLLLDYGADKNILNTKTPIGQPITPARYARYLGRHDIADFIDDYGSDPIKEPDHY